MEETDLIAEVVKQRAKSLLEPEGLDLNPSCAAEYLRDPEQAA